MSSSYSNSLTFNAVFQLFGLDPSCELSEADMRNAKKQMLRMHPDKSHQPPEVFLHYQNAYDKLARFYSAAGNNRRTNDHYEAMRALPTEEERARYIRNVADVYYEPTERAWGKHDREVQEIQKTVYDKMKDLQGSAFQKDFNAMFDEYEKLDPSRQKMKDRERRRYEFMREGGDDTQSQFKSTKYASNHPRDVLQGMMKPIRKEDWEPKYTGVTSANLGHKFQEILRQHHPYQGGNPPLSSSSSASLSSSHAPPSMALTRRDYVPYMAKASMSYSAFHENESDSEEEREEIERQQQQQQASYSGNSDRRHNALQTRNQNYHSHGIGGRGNDLMYDDLRRVYRDGGGLFSVPDDPALLPPTKTVEQLKEERKQAFTIAPEAESRRILEQEAEEARRLNYRRQFQLQERIENTNLQVLGAMRAHMRLT